MRVLLAGVLVLLALGPAPLAYAADEQQVSITIDDLAPATPDRNATIVIKGRVTNTSSEPIANAQALFWRDWSPITSSDGLDQALQAAATQPIGGRVTDTGAYQDLTTDQHPTLAPGETASFQVQAQVPNLELPRTGGVYLMGVHVLGKVGKRSTATLGRARTFVPLPRQGAESPAVTSPSVVILSSRPSMIGPALFSDDHLADELTVTGRLTHLMTLAKRPDMAYAIDPALLRAVRAMAREEEPYQVRQADGTHYPGMGRALAQRWLEDFESLDPQRGHRLPYALPDLAPLAHQGLEPTFQRIQNATKGVADDLPLLAYAHTGRADTETVNWIERLHPSAILVSTARTSQALVAPVGRAPIVTFSADLYAGGPGPDPRTTLTQRRQRMLAESWLAAQSGTTQVRVIDSGEAAQIEATTDVAWIHRQPLTELLGHAPTEWTPQFTYTDAMRSEELTHRQVDRVRELTHADAAYAEMMIDPAPRQRATDMIVASSVSSWWRGEPNAFAQWIDPLVAEAQDLLSGARVTLTAQRTVIMSGQAGSFPVTITNKLSEPVRVAIDFDSAQPQRLSIARHENIEVPAGQSTTINVRGRAAANGPVEVTAQLITPGGTPLGRRTRMEVRATNFGFVGWIIVICSGIVLLATTALRIRQVARERAATAAPEGTPPVISIEPTEGNGL